MKSIILIIILIACKVCQAQTYDEWVRQKKTQEKYLKEQILALKAYIGYAEEGYSIASKGLRSIRDIKNGDLKIHNIFFSSLTSVNPQVKKYSKVAAIIAMQISIANFTRKTMKQCTASKLLTHTELNYLREVFNKVLDESAKDMDALMALITDEELEMKDDERIKVVDKLYPEMQDRQVFVQAFGSSAKGLYVQRRNDNYDINKLNRLK